MNKGKEESKQAQLKQAAEEYLGIKGVDIKFVLGNTYTPQTEVKIPQMKAEPPVSKPIQKEMPKAEAEEINEDDTYYEEQMKKAEPQQESEIDTSSQVKMIQELFDGKVI